MGRGVEVGAKGGGGGYEEGGGVSDSLGFSTEKTLISASALIHDENL